MLNKNASCDRSEVLYRNLFFVVVVFFRSVSARIPTHWVGTVASNDGKEFTEADEKAITQVNKTKNPHTSNTKNNPTLCIYSASTAVVASQTGSVTVIVHFSSDREGLHCMICWAL